MKHHNNIIISTVLYNPDDIFVYNYLNSIKNISRLDVAIFDNSDVAVNFNQNLIENKIYYFHSNENIGLGGALNFLGKFAKINNAKWLIYFDQDTIFSEKTLNATFELLEFINNNLNTYKKIGSISLRSKSTSLWNKDSICLKRITNPYGSAIIYNVEILEAVNYHNNKIFLDCVDYDFNYRIRKSNFIQLTCNNIPDIDHFSQQPITNIYIIGKKITFFLFRYYPLNRIKRTVALSILILFKCIYTIDIKLALEILKFLITYISLQLVYKLYAHLKK